MLPTQRIQQKAVVSPATRSCRKFSYIHPPHFPTCESDKFGCEAAPGLGTMTPSHQRGGNMKSSELTSEIKELNLTYLMLAQQMVIADKDMAVFRLGISRDIANILEVLTPGQILKLANSNLMLCRIRFDDNLVFGMLANYKQDRAMAQSHAAILMAGQPAEEIS